MGAAVMGFRPRYDVQLVAEKGKHFYDVTLPGVTGTLGIIRLPGVTGILDVIGGGKTHALVAWATKTALTRVDEEFTKRLKDQSYIKANREWMDTLLKDARKKPEKVKDAAADIGTRVHNFIDAIIKDEPRPELQPDMVDAVNAFLKWQESAGVKILAGDTKVANLEDGYGGSLDCLAEVNGKVSIVDFKTSNGIRDTYAVQTAAYGRAFQLTYGIEANDCYVVRFGKDKAEFEVKKVVSPERSYEAFRHAIGLQKFLQEDIYA